MGGGGGGSSSSSNTSSATTNLDKRQVVDGSSIGVSSDSSTVNITALDHGAIDKAGAVVQAALLSMEKSNAIQGDNLAGVLGLAGENSASNSKSLNQMTAANTDNINKIVGLAGSNTDLLKTGFSSVLDLASELFSGGFGALKTSQAQLSDAYSQATDLKQSAGSIDNKTMMVLGIAAAGALVMIAGKK